MFLWGVKEQKRDILALYCFPTFPVIVIKLFSPFQRTQIQFVSFMLNSSRADIAVKGPYPADTVLWHETGHNLDYWVAGKGISSWSDSMS